MDNEKQPVSTNDIEWILADSGLPNELDAIDKQAMDELAALSAYREEESEPDESTLDMTGEKSIFIEPIVIPSEKRIREWVLFYYNAERSTIRAELRRQGMTDGEELEKKAREIQDAKIGGTWE